MAEQPAAEEGMMTLGTVERHPPEEVFALLGDETRVRILQVLGEGPNEPRSFSTLHEAVGVEDSGQFNYHLRKMTDHFVRKVEGGYELTLAGRQLMGALQAGTYTASASMEPLSIDTPCPECGGTLVAEYVDEHVEMSCEDCEEWRNLFPFPPGALESFDRTELPRAFDRWMWSLMERIYAGFCPTCSGRMSSQLVHDEDRSEAVRLDFTCAQCDEVARFSAVTALFFDTGIACFFRDAGIDFRDLALWEISSRTEKDLEVSADPLSVRITLAAGDHSVTATVTEDARIVDVERSPGT